MLNRYVNRIFKKGNNTGKNPGDDIKKIIIGQYTLSAHKDHKLDNYLLHHPEYSQNFPRISYEIVKEKPGISIIDVGANIGDTLALLRKYDVKNTVFCVEGDQVYYSFLQENAKQFTDVSLLKYYLSDTDENKGYNVQSDGGTARIVEGENSTIQSALITLDKLSELTDLGTVGIIKIDTDGFDCKIIKGSLNLIAKYKPVLFFEYDYDLAKQQNETPLEVLSILRDRGYNGIIYFDNYGKTICATTLHDVPQLTILDNYIHNGKGAFPYYDVFVFHQQDELLMKKIITKELNSI